MLFKRNDQCLITTIPNNFYPVDGALGMKEIVDVVRSKTPWFSILSSWTKER